MNLSDIKAQIFKDTVTNATSYPAADMIIDINNAANRVHAKIRKYLDDFRPTTWTTADLATGTATPSFDPEFHELIPLYVDVTRANGRALPGLPGWLERIHDLEDDLGKWYAARNYSGFTVTIASPGIITSPSHGLYTGDRVTFITSGALPTGLAADTFYYVVGPVTDDTFAVSATKNGTAINTSVSQTGTHYFASDRPKRMTPAFQDNR
jgi:hypothetical protein